ncbi:hypothetical protein NBRC116592_24860 [Colwellia sp. KU-HH00111]|uniref:porin n=1 Tax=Colwellia sp. KU-HH00111 TaxID=3127652 RepID=UPI00310AF21C
MKNLHKALILSSAIFAANSQAEITLNGFASIVGGVTTSSDDTLYGYDQDIDFSQGSLFAIQASADLGDSLTATVQLLARGENDWDPDFEWAYIAYDASDNLRVLAGRQRVPFYMYSDFLDVSYAYPWITPPEGVYSVAFDTFDGLGAIYSTSMGSFDANFHMIYGGNNSEITVAGETVKPDFIDSMGLVATITRDWLTLRTGYLQTEMNIPLQGTQPLIQGWQAAGFDSVANDINVMKDTGSFLEFGFQIDYNNWLVIGEYTELNLDGTILPNQDSFYVLAGYRFDNMLVHVTYGEDDDARDRVTENVPVVDQLLPLLVPTNGLSDSQKNQASYINLGLRWDFHDSAALKFEYMSYSDDLNSNNDAGLFRTALVAVF